MPVSGHRAALDALGLPPAAIPGLQAYLDALARWSERASLTAARTPAARVDLLIGRVLPALAYLEAPSLLDVGSGNGSPGLVLALLRPELAVTLLEPRQKRWAFLREACRAAGRPELTVLRRRHDTYDGPPAATVTVRALRLPAGELAPLVRPGGRLLVFGHLEGERPGGEPEPFREEAAAPGLRVLRRP